MTTFWIIGALLMVVAMLFVALPLWRSSVKSNDVLRDAANLEILRDQSAELEADLRNGLLTQEAYEQGKLELQKRLVDEVKVTSQSGGVVSSNPAKRLAIILALVLPIFSVLLYLKVGNPNAMLIGGHGGAAMNMDVMVEELEKKVAQQPDNPNNVVLLARTYAGLKRYPDAVRAYQKLVELVPNEAQVWTEYAEALGMQNGRTLKGEPTKLLDKALELDSNNLWALGLAGTAAMEREDYVMAVTYWQKLLSLLPPDNPDIQSVRNDVQHARDLLAQQPGGKEKLAKLPAVKAPELPANAAAAAITGKVSLSPALAGKVAPTDVVFILARAAQGPKMPLAVMRKQVSELPFEFKLDDSMAMQQQMKLSNFDQVVVVARVSKSGTPMAQPGDLEGKVNAKTGSKDLEITIDTVVQ
ncbi:MAG TPA: c-type cytochrome biogenesis protein CcmI [Gallionella sp.]|nr:c-type cytochrome biogenesis protein CcmI [Gallionella sp.]